VSRTRERRGEIRQLIASRPIGTQEELRALLAGLGHDVTQATLSRDLAQLGARRTARPDGGTIYELGEAPRTPLLSDLVRSLDDNGTLVVIRTASGAAQVVANAIDRASLPEVIGTIAGDDTIFVAPSRATPPARLLKRLRTLVSEV
jgi:transcriptional regulator of arginine metabolism